MGYLREVMVSCAKNVLSVCLLRERLLSMAMLMTPISRERKQEEYDDDVQRQPRLKNAEMQRKSLLDCPPEF